MKRIVTNANGDKFIRSWTPGPKPKGYVKFLVNIPAEYLAVMKAINAECGGMRSVNQQIRDAIRGHLCGLIYTSLFKQ